MPRILVLGAAPLPFEPQERQYAANLRTWHFTQPLVAAGHEIRLVACRLPKTYPEGIEPETRAEVEGMDYVSVSGELFNDPAYLQRHHDEFEPDAVVGVNTHPASRAAALDTDRPVWCDLNGWVMAEAQTKTFVYDDDRFLSHFWNMERTVLDRADVISTVSEAQTFATIGELATRGRLGRQNFGYDFVRTIPNAIAGVAYAPTSQLLRGSLVPEDAFVVLWVGGYNTWTDVDLLFESLTSAMAEVPELQFVSTGGVIEGHDEITFTRFRERVDASPLSNRFHFVGWVPTADVPNYYFESDLGLNVDAANYETTFGARNRLNEMIKTGLPVLTTRGTEISRLIEDEGFGLVAPMGDADRFAERMRWAAANRDETRRMAEKARDYAAEHLSYAATTKSLVAWAEDPHRAPDGGDAVSFEDLDFFTAAAESEPEPDPEASSTRSADGALRQDAERWQSVAEDYRRQLGSIHGSKMWSLWMSYLALRRGILRLLGRG